MICIETRGLHSVIVIDDDVDTADIMSLALQEHGLLAVPAYSGDQGLSLVEQIRPSTVILDIDMPGLSGLEVCRRIRRAPWGASIRIIVFSGWGYDSHLQAAKNAGCDVFLAKPATMADVLSAVSVEPAKAAAVRQVPRPCPASPSWDLGHGALSDNVPLPALPRQVEVVRRAEARAGSRAGSPV